MLNFNSDAIPFESELQEWNKLNGPTFHSQVERMGKNEIAENCEKVPKH